VCGGTLSLVFLKVALKQARNYCNGEGYSCVLHEVVIAFVPVKIIMSWLVVKIRFKV
jgi:hypothetical protein